jgi:uncharacterized protein (TIGR03790 family)
MIARLSFLLALISAFHPIFAAEPLNNRVLVVYSVTSHDSESVAKHYLAARHIPPSHLCGIKIPDDEAKILKTPEYERYFKGPISACLNKVGKERILYIVLAYVRPYRLDPGGVHNYSLDAFLADIWDYYTSRIFDPLPNVMQPYFAPNRAKLNVYLPFVPFAEFRAQPYAPIIYSVWRLDAPTPFIARTLVDKAIAAENAHGPYGQACIDERVNPLPEPDEGARMGDWDLYRAARFLSAAGFTVLEDQRDLRPIALMRHCTPAGTSTSTITTRSRGIRARSAFTWIALRCWTPGQGSHGRWERSSAVSR